MIIRAGGIVSIAGVVSMIAASASACSGSESNAVNEGPRVGSEGGPCPAAGTSCDVGLVCLSNLCVRPAETDGSPSASSSSSSSGSNGSSGGPADASTDEAAAFDAADCKFKHPLLDAGLRFCGPGDCYCKGADSCYPKSIAAACCGGSEGTCY